MRASAISAFPWCLTELALGAIRSRDLQIEVPASGALLLRFRKWLREEPILVDPGDGDLGAWLLRAIEPSVFLFGADGGVGVGWWRSFRFGLLATFNDSDLEPQEAP